MLVASSKPLENFRLLHEAGCIQTMCDVYPDVKEAEKNFLGRFCTLMVLTNLNPCDECPVLQGCKAYKEYNTQPKEEKAAKEDKIKVATTPDNGPFGSMSVKQIAKKYNISISQVRRLKVQGKLETLTTEGV